MQALSGTLQGYLASGSLLAYAAVFGGGLLIGFSPCIYPVLPITVGYIGSRSAGRRGTGFLLGVAYAVGMAAVYAVLGSAAALSGTVFGQEAASPWANLLVGNVCILMALSLFDLFHLPVPSFLQKVRGERREGIGGAFLVGAASGLVVGPCTAPVLGSLLVYVSTKKNLPFGASLLFVFALGMGVLPVLAGTFTGLLATLPKPGRWMETIRKGFGVFLILVGEYFLIEAGRLLV
jgi:cytochrome c-type biogenesis protein